MATTNIKVYRDEVYDEAAKLSAYTSAKKIDVDALAYDRIAMTDDDFETLGRFWDEVVSAVNERLGQMLVSGSTKSEASGNTPPVVRHFYGAQLATSSSYNTALTDSVQESLKSYFINSIVGKWYALCNKEETNDILLQAAENLNAAERMLYSRNKPTRPPITTTSISL